MINKGRKSDYLHFIGNVYIMNTDFTFAIITYNNEKYILDHLESIKNLITHYGQGYRVFLVLSDDCSQDDTISKVNEWVESYKYLFYKVDIFRQKTNVGTVKNYISTISRVPSQHFKILAGDDKYNGNNIFETCKFGNDRIIVTPVEFFGNVDKNYIDSMKIEYEYIRFLIKKNKLSFSFGYNYTIPAPGLFFPKSFFDDDQLKEFLCNFILTEDYPMMYYFIRKKKYPIEYIDKKYVAYRVGSGVSKGGFVDERYIKDVETAHRLLNKSRKLPKYLNPYTYWSKYQRFLFSRTNK